MIKSVVFDIGNVLWNYEEFHQELFVQWGKLVDKSGPALYQEFEPVYIGLEKGTEFYQDWLAELKPGLDLEQAEAKLAQLIDQHFDRYLNYRLLAQIPELKRRHIIVGCLSNTENFMKRFHQKLEKKVDFDFRILSYQVGSRKPEKKIYQEIFKYVDFAPAEILFIDDKPENVAGAKKFGLKAQHYTSLDETIGQLEEIGN